MKIERPFMSVDIKMGSFQFFNHTSNVSAPCWQGEGFESQPYRFIPDTSKFIPITTMSYVNDIISLAQKGTTYYYDQLGLVLSVLIKDQFSD